MNMRNILFVVAVSMMSLCTQSTSYIVKAKSRIKKSITHSKYIYSPTEYDNVTNSRSTSTISNATDLSMRLVGKVEECLLNATTAKVPIFIIDVSIFSAKFIDYICNGLTVLIAAKDFQKFSNGSAFVPFCNMMINKSNHLVIDDTLFLCAKFYEEHTAEQKLLLKIKIVYIVCVGISTVCIILYIITFILVEKLRKRRGYCLVSFIFALLLAYLCSLIQFERSNHTDCTIIGMFLLYFILVSLFWMNIITYDLWRSVWMATKLRSTENKPFMLRFAMYSVYAWGMPLMIIITSVIVHNTTSDKKYTLIFNVNTCWFRYKQALAVYFAIPLFSLLGINVIFFISSFYMIIMTSMSRSQTGSQSGSKAWARMFRWLGLACVMGFMGIFGFIAAATEVLWLWYLYSVCNALQGVFVLLIASEKIREICAAHFR